jgi:hypothetical protein
MTPVGERRPTERIVEALVATLEDPIPEDVVWIPVNEIVIVRKNQLLQRACRLGDIPCSWFN